MKKIKATIIIILMFFSFYLSEQITTLAINKNPIMISINKTSDSLTVMGIDAQIKDNTIIPGIAGKIVDKEASFFKMKEFGTFNETFLVYKDIKPNISVEDNKDKIIVQGNNDLRQVSIIIDDTENLINYFKNKNIEISILSKLNTELDDQEYLNAEKTKDNFNDLDSILKKHNLNKKICIINYSNIELCKEKKYYLVDPTIKVSNANIYKNKKDLTKGAIIYIDKNVTEKSINILLNQIKYLDLKIVYLSQLIKE